MLIFFKPLPIVTGVSTAIACTSCAIRSACCCAAGEKMIRAVSVLICRQCVDGGKPPKFCALPTNTESKTLHKKEYQVLKCISMPKIKQPKTKHCRTCSLFSLKFWMMLLLALAIAPGLAICVYILYRDVHNREPALNMILSFVFGIVSIIP